MSSSSQQLQQQNLGEGSRTMDLTQVINHKDASKKKLSQEQNQVLRIAEIKAELAKRNQVNADITKTIEKILQSANYAHDSMSSDNFMFKSLKERLDSEEESAEHDIADVRYILMHMEKDPYTLGMLEAQESLEVVLKQVEMALHLVGVWRKTREKMMLLAEGKE